MTIQISHTVDGIVCDSCGDEFPGGEIVQHLKDVHGYSREDLKPYALQIDVNIDEVLCEHPNGFGVNGCAGCGFSPDDIDLPDMSSRLGLVRDGVTTEIRGCTRVDVHSRHLHRPAKDSEWFTCNGLTNMAARVKSVEEAARTLREATEVPQNLLPPAESTTAFRTGTERPSLESRMRTAAGILEGMRRISDASALFRSPIPKLQPLVPEENSDQAFEFLTKDQLPPLSVPATTDQTSLSCPECGVSYARGDVLLHLREEEAVDQSVLDEFADVHHLPPLDPPNTDVDECPVCEGRPGDCRECGRTDTDKLRPLTDKELREEFYVNGEDELTEWWLRRANEEAEAVIPKAVAYGSNSLMQLGRKMAQLQGREVSDAEAMELGCWVNAVQKIERWTDAVMRGERCSDDTIYDAGIYVKMVQRIRDTGSWPGV